MNCRPRVSSAADRHGRPAVLAASLALSLVAACAASGGDDARPARTVPGSHSAVPDAGLPRGVTLRHSTQTWGDGRTARVHVLAVAPDAAAHVTGVHGAHLATAETVREMADRAGAVAAVNGGYFDISTGAGFGGYPGDPLGVYAADGTLLSEAAAGRTALVVGPRGTPPRITRVWTELSLTADDGARRELDGIDRVPGRVLGCGGTGGDVLSSTGRAHPAPLHNRLCVDSSEIVRFTPEWGAASRPGTTGTAEAVLDAEGRVTAVRSPAGGPIPRGGSTMYGIGEGARWLTEHARPGGSVTVETRAQDAAGRSLLAPGVSLFGAGPGLVENGAVSIDPAREGMSQRSLDERAPRTLAGIRADGTLLLVVVDGRTPSSAGATAREAATLAAGIGARSALNLDGGGSSTLVVRGRLENRPMDEGAKRTVERRVATAIAVVG
ncbi:phosphodiester glycosidase family protein [Streptomyces longispororuber]|uniref:phosphodiester glycosidase family protein n=1 Tax=Streptomyces longispororuber TaxID=68230 RepID=UPI0021096C8C|nr:phosphodiester glycosidase family protein [Streptomyces longispororuber]MCQ4210626.1 phosphodiester glycosidase family protein [Streptomyces longispororuber]